MLSGLWQVCPWGAQTILDDRYWPVNGTCVIVYKQFSKPIDKIIKASYYLSVVTFGSPYVLDFPWSK